MKLGDGRIRTISCKSLRRRGKRMVEREIKIVQKESTRDTVPMQERVLQEAMQKKKVISVILVNGFHMKGILEEYDRYAIWIESDHQNQLVYKHAISTIRL
ncbi:RNA chaperone Hfq [Bacillus cereus]|uniref:RNA chaperone Hfq n=1 Tax=Bacillus cereus TaxID=1396 RepID=UPI003C6BF8A0